jgi:cytochrome c2
MNRQLTSLLCLALALAACGGREEPGEREAPKSADRLEAPADTAFGRRLFRQCAQCHDARPADGHRVGPNLWSVLGEQAARHPDFRYSRAMEASGIVWDETSLDAYIRSPQAFIPGNRMAYDGMADPADRRDLIAYLRSLED